MKQHKTDHTIELKKPFGLKRPKAVFRGFIFVLAIFLNEFWDYVGGGDFNRNLENAESTFFKPE